MIVVRPLDRSDLDVVIENLSPDGPEHFQRRMEEQERGGAVWLVAWLDGVAIGYVGVSMRNDHDVDAMLEARGYALVEYLFVDASYRRRGAARALMGSLERLARSNGMPGVILDTGVGDDFAAARGLYASLGYVDQGGVYLGGWSDPDQPGVNLVDALTLWIKTF